MEEKDDKKATRDDQTHKATSGRYASPMKQESSLSYLLRSNVARASDAEHISARSGKVSVDRSGGLPTCGMLADAWHPGMESKQPLPRIFGKRMAVKIVSVSRSERSSLVLSRGKRTSRP